MDINIGEKVNEIAGKLSGDKDLAKDFEKDPAGIVQKILGDKVPADIIQAIIDGVKAKLGSGGLGSIGDKIKGLFNK